MSRPEKWKQTFVKFTVKLALDRHLTLKTLDRYVSVELKVVSYILENILFAGRKDKLEKKKGLKYKMEIKERRYGIDVDLLNIDNCLKWKLRLIH